MKDSFRGYYKPSGEEFDTLWRDAVFVLDASVLLGLYRLRPKARDELLAVLRTLGARLWVPYHAALEYQANRLSVIADQKQKFRDVTKLISTTFRTLEQGFSELQISDRHSLIDSQPFMSKAKKLFDQFATEVSSLEGKQFDVHETDTVRTQIEELLEGKIGEPPSPDDVSTWAKEAKRRYELHIPPGYADRGKAGAFTYGGAVYERAYGDVYFWKQVVQRAHEQSTTDLILVTDDAKEDWIWHFDSGGRKRLGPRPELTEEISREASVQRFYIYTTANFLKFAGEKLDAEVSGDTLIEVQEAASLSGESPGTRARIFSSVESWLGRVYPHGVLRVAEGWGHDVEVLLPSGLSTSFEVITFNRRDSFRIKLRNRIDRANSTLSRGAYNSIELVLALRTEDGIQRAIDVASSFVADLPTNITILIGRFEAEHDEFVPIWHSSHPPYTKSSEYGF